jgi:DNA-binding transcriptional MerR regulator
MIIDVRTNELRPFTTREAAARCGLSPRNLRRLERRGLVPSASGRSRVKGYRLYTANDVSTILSRLAAMKDAA